MMLEKDDEFDLQQLTENVSFLVDCFDNSFAIQNSLNYIKDNGIESDCMRYSQKQKLISKGNGGSSQISAIANCSFKAGLHSNSKVDVKLFNKQLRNWGLPLEITKKYENRGISEMFDWQVECLSNTNILLNCHNLVYSAPTSAGKTLVAEILAIKTVLERQKKVIIILPFVSIVREKMFYLQDILSSSGVRVEGFMGSQSPPGGLQAVHIAICTIEKANSLINKLLDEGNITELGAVIVDELHLLGDPHRGYILELLLTKIKYVSSRLDNVNIQIIGMSATLPNLEVLANWLDAELYITEFRPIPLHEYCLVGDKYYDKNGKCTGSFSKINVGSANECDYVLPLCLDTIKEGCSILIFCMTKNRCECLAQSIASSFYKLGSTNNEQGTMLRQQLKSNNIVEVLEQLRNCPVGLDEVLKNIISFGVAYHHAGLTFDERDIIEGAFKSGAIRVLVATSTLSSGVNLPARKVIVRSPVFQKQPINILTYKQMIGRAGRMGKDTQGESILICSSAEQKIGFQLMMGTLHSVESCIESKDKFMRAILEIIASQDVCKRSELDLYTKCTLLFAQQSGSTSQNILLDDTLKELINFELIRLQEEGEDRRFVATSFGKACLSSSLAPNDGLSLFCEVQKARQCLVLETDLHLVYLVTPYSVSNQWNDIDWLHLLTLWESLTAAMKRVGELVGVQESFIIRCLRSGAKSTNSQTKLSIHKRFYTALALQDLINEVPLSEVARKFQCARGFLQGLQQSSATFAGMVTAFCHQLGWKNMETLVSQFQDRLQFGIHSELLELMKLPSLNGVRARTLFDAGFESISSIASADVYVIENTLHKSIPFQSEKERDEDDVLDVRKRNKIRNIWITGYCGMTSREAAENLILEARKYLTQEIGVSEIKWKDLRISENNMNSTCDIDKALVKAKTDDKINAEPQIDLQIKSAKINKSISNIMSTPKDINCVDKVYSNSQKINLSSDSSEQINHDIVSKKNETVDKVSNVQLEKFPEQRSNFINKSISTSKVNTVQEDLIWESLNFTEGLIENITNLRTSDNFFSPNISFGEEGDLSMVNDDMNEIVTSKSNSISPKDVSLFTSEDESSSILEASFSSDVQYIQTNTSQNTKFVTITGEINMNSKSMLNAFKSSIIAADDDEDFKLVYDDDFITNEISIGLKECEEYEIITQNIKESQIKTSYISPHKRRTYLGKDSSQSLAKRQKQSGTNIESTEVKPKSAKSRNFTLKFAKQYVRCEILRENDVNANILNIENALDISIILDIGVGRKKSNDIIGNNIILNEPKTHAEKQRDKLQEIPVNGVSICLNDTLCLYLDLTSLGKLSAAVNYKLKRLLSNASFKFKTLNAKSVYVYVKTWLGIDLSSKCIDITLAEWLLDSDESIFKIVDLTKKYCDIDLLNTQITINDQRKCYSGLDKCEVACLKAWCVWAVAAKQNEYLISKYMFLEKELFRESQVAKILGDCEYHGITVDKNLASQLLIDVKNSQEVLQKKAFKLCGYHFNFNSSKDVAKVLGIYNGRKVSTRKSILSAHKSPMASIVIYWRKLNSILTKTLYPLTEQAFNYSKDDRINPTYTMYTSTGRISMHEPNLQNVPRTFSIPLRYLDAKYENVLCDDVKEFNCRNIFKASTGYVFVSADYCQLEMRIMTHYCKDAVLTRIMSSNVDVFKSIAASWSGVPEEQVDDDLRQKAKQLCYGIIYGMGNRTLAQHLDVNEIEAAMFMDTFYKTYPSIKVFTKGLIDECKNNGYVETLMKRRRYLPDIKSNVVSKKNSAERQAVNTTIQGSAADIAKAAMCAINNNTKYIEKPRLILQMHDELIYEVIESEKMNFIQTIKKIMENTVTLNVPLPVKVKSGYTWGSMEEVKF